MKFRIGLFAALITALLVSTHSVSAQAPFSNQYNTPTLSPYLNLNQFGGVGILNYFTLVQPQLQQQQQLNQQRGQLQQLQRGANSQSPVPRSGQPLGGAQIRTTGHASAYMNYSHYYQFQSPARR